MTRDEIIRMAREACDPDKVDAWSNGFWTLTQEELERFAAFVAQAERAACKGLWEAQRLTDSQISYHIKASNFRPKR